MTMRLKSRLSLLGIAKRWRGYPSKFQTTHFVLAIATAAASTSTYASNIKVMDDADRTVSLQQPAQRIVSLAPHITELLFAIGAGPQIVGTTHYSDYPAAANQIPRIGGYDKVNLEKIVTLQPDLIVAWQSGNNARTNQRLEQMGYAVYYSEPETLTDIAKAMANLGKLVGNPSKGEAARDDFLQRYNGLKAQHHQQRPLKIYYEVWQNPRYTLGGSHFTREIFMLCGATNIFADVQEKAPIVSLEAIISRNPDVILTGQRHGDENLQALRNHWQQWPQIAAVKQAQIYYVDADIFTRSSPRAIEAAEALCALLGDIR